MDENLPEKRWHEAKVHPAAAVLPMLPDDELEKLGQDIKEHGLRERIKLWRRPDDGEIFIVDGRNRIAAMRKVGLDLEATSEIVTTWLQPNADLVSWIVSHNFLRRHMTKQELADKLVESVEAGADFAKVARSVKRNSNGRLQGSTKDPIKEKVMEQAKAAGVSKRTTERALAKKNASSEKSAKPTRSTKIQNPEGRRPRDKADPKRQEKLDAIFRKATSYLQKELDDLKANSEEIARGLRQIGESFDITIQARVKQ